MATRSRTKHVDPGPLCDQELQLRLADFVEADALMDHVPTYYFHMLNRDTKALMGHINLRAGDTERIQRYRGHLGYNVMETYRGNRYAARSIRLLLPFALRLELDPLWITCNPENVASRRTCETAGADFVEIVDLPSDEEMYRRGDRQKCRYRLSTSTLTKDPSEYELISPQNVEQWQRYHDIRRRVLFESRGLFDVYRADHPDDSQEGKYPLILVQRGETLGVIRIDIEKDTAFLRRVAVRDDLQRRGHGRKMLELAGSFARERGCSLLRAFSNPEAVGFYEACGFSRDRDVGSPENTVSVSRTCQIDAT